MTKTVLLLDDEPNILRDLGERLSRLGYAIYKCHTVDEAGKIILSEAVDFAVIDLEVDFRSDHGGIDAVVALKRRQPRAQAIVLSAYRQTQIELSEETALLIDAWVSKKEPGNYIRHVIETLATFDKAALHRLCFVLMPFSATMTCTEREWTEIFEAVIKPAVEGAGLGFDCHRSDAVQGSIIEHVLDRVNRADLVIADLTDRNPNVFYELGVRHTLRDSTILLSQRLDDIPFDLRHYAVQTYGWKLESDRADFARKMHHILTQIIQEPKLGASPVRKYLCL